MTEQAAVDSKLIVEFNENQQQISRVEKAISEKVKEFQDHLRELQARDTELRGTIKDAMEKAGMKKIENDFVSITYIAPTIRKSIDAERLRLEKPITYDEYIKESPIKSSIRITIKEEK